MRVSSSEVSDPTASTKEATPPPTTSAMASDCAHIRRKSRSSLMSRADIRSPAQLCGMPASLVPVPARDLPVGKEQHAVGDLLDTGIVGDDEGGRAELLVDLEKR